MAKQNKHSIIGIISFSIGIFNILVSAVIYWALWSYLNHKFGEVLLLQVQILNIGSKVEIITKPLGLVLGVIGLIQKTKRKHFATIGVIINVIAILWTLASNLWF